MSSLQTNGCFPSALTGVDSLSGINTPHASCPTLWPVSGAERGHWIPLCIAICIQLQLVLTRSLYIKQSAGQIKIMAITHSGLHILSAAKVRAESMNASVDPVEGIWSGDFSLSLSFFIYFPSSPGSLRIYQALISSVLVWVTALSRRYWWNGSGSCSVSLA